MWRWFLVMFKYYIKIKDSFCCTSKFKGRIGEALFYRCSCAVRLLFFVCPFVFQNEYLLPFGILEYLLGVPRDGNNSVFLFLLVRIIVIFVRQVLLIDIKKSFKYKFGRKIGCWLSSQDLEVCFRSDAHWYRFRKLWGALCAVPWVSLEWSMLRLT